MVVGSGGVGKSCLTVRFLKGEFSNEYDPTIEENYRKLVSVDGHNVMMNIVDTAGQQEYYALRDQHLQSGQAFLLVFAVNDKDSFKEVQKLRQSIFNLRNVKRLPLVVAGNKCDIPESSRQVTQSEAEQWCQSVKVPYMETSAKNNINVSEAFYNLVREIWRHKPATSSTKSKAKGNNYKSQKGCVIT